MLQIANVEMYKFVRDEVRELLDKEELGLLSAEEKARLNELADAMVLYVRDHQPGSHEKDWDFLPV